MKAFVTGATGFIGARLCEILAAEGAEVTALALPGEDVGRVAPYCAHIVRGDITEPASLRGVCPEGAVVFHLAARVTDWGRRGLFYAAIYDGARNMLEACKGRASRFVQVSSIAACGLGRHLKGVREDEPCIRSGVPYNDAKADAEDMVRDYHGRGDLECVIVRPANVIGPGSVWVRDVVDRYRLMRVPLLDGGRYSASLVDVGNLAKGIYLAGTTPRAAGQTYHLRDDWDVTWQRYVTDLGAMLGKRPGPSLPFGLAWGAGAVLEAVLTPLNIRAPMTRLAAGVMGRDNDVDASKARSELGWRSEISYQESMADIKTWVGQYTSDW